MPLISFYTPENTRKPLVFWCFQGVLKDISDMKWVRAFSVKKIMYRDTMVLLNFNKKDWKISFLSFTTMILILKTAKSCQEKAFLWCSLYHLCRYYCKLLIFSLQYENFIQCFFSHTVSTKYTLLLSKIYIQRLNPF